MAINPLHTAQLAILAATDPEAFAELAASQGLKPEQLKVPGIKMAEAPTSEAKGSRTVPAKSEPAGITDLIFDMLNPQPQLAAGAGSEESKMAPTFEQRANAIWAGKGSSQENVRPFFASSTPPQVIPQETMRPPTPLPATFPVPGQVQVQPQPSDSLPQTIQVPGQVKVQGQGMLPPMPVQPPIPVPPVMHDVPTMPQAMLPQPVSGGHGFPLPLPPLMMPFNSPAAQNVVPPQPAPPMGEVPTAPMPQQSPMLPLPPGGATLPGPMPGAVAAVPGGVGIQPPGAPDDRPFVGQDAGESGLVSWLTGLISGASQDAPAGGFGRSPGQVAGDVGQAGLDVLGSLWRNSQARATLTGGPPPPAPGPAVTPSAPIEARRPPVPTPRTIATQPVTTASATKAVPANNMMKSATAVDKEVANAAAQETAGASTATKLAAASKMLSGITGAGGGGGAAGGRPPSAGVVTGAIQQGQLLDLLFGRNAAMIAPQFMPFAKAF